MIHESSANIQGDARGCGVRLREARIAAGLSLQEVATKLRMPVHVVQALEDGRWQVIGASVFVRGQLRSYARLLDVDVEPFLDTEVAPAAPVDLVSHAHAPRYQRLMENMGRRAVYVVITAAIAVPVWLATRSHFADAPPTTASLDAVPPETVPALPAQSPVLPATGVGSGVAGTGDVEPAGPYVASLAPPVSRAAPSAAGKLVLDFNGESWMQVVARDGSTLEQGLMHAGDSRSFDAAGVGRVVLGNASVVRVQQAGSIVDTTPYQRANVARFAVSSDGSVTAE
ncbi:helix-turn-helix domain-containing protein [Pseudoxanthomonas suwonensis]|uniref:Membrane protein n=1 Tax=Pseudoxanthomonas suwonensis TaxID=314722 RepID=A0A0E3Z148_9GAMM|nr:helix-turn-helix domain-containing protein [Pseudoxanthomonas suwonensis]AKC85442.1 membrane protein [Pseudoxanthomonas suwonensis]